MRTYCLNAAAILSSALWSSVALAAPPPPTYLKQVGSPSFPGLTPQGQSSTSASTLTGAATFGPGSGPPNFVANASSSTTPTPKVSTDVATPTPGVGSYAARSMMRYYFAVTGPDAAAVPLLLTGFTQTIASGGVGFVGVAEASLISYDKQGVATVLVDRACGTFAFFPQATNVCNPSPASFSLNGIFQSVTSASDFSGYFDLIANADILSAASTGFNIVQSFIDPLITIDPTFLANHPGYSVVVSQGIGNEPTATAVPEPATWTMLLAGFGAVGAAMRRRRVSSAPLPSPDRRSKTGRFVRGGHFETRS